MMKTDKYLVLLLCVFWILLTFSFAIHSPVLADDLTHFNRLKQFQEGKIGIQNVFEVYFYEDPNRQSRPMSSLAISLFNIVSKPSTIIFFLGGLLGLVYLFLFRKILWRYFKENPTFISIVLMMSLIFPLSSSNIYSVVMHSIQLIIGSFFCSILLINKRKNIFHFLAGIVILFSLLLYEQNIFLIPIIAMITIYHFKLSRSSIFKIFLSCGLPIIFLGIYRIWLIKLIYLDYFDYGSSKIYFDITKNLGLIFSFIKLFIFDYAYIVYKSILSIPNYHWIDFILLIIGTLAIVNIIRNIQSNEKQISKGRIFFILIFFLLSIFLFFISTYPPIAFGFENRILIWVRYSSSLVLAVGFYHFITGSYHPFIKSSAKAGIFIFLFCNVISVISQKNSWILASKYNKNIIKNITNNFQENQENTQILYIKDSNKIKSFVTDEGTLGADYEVNAALNLYSKNSNFNPKNILFFNPTHYSLYKIGNIELNKRPKTEYELTTNGINIGKLSLTYPFFIYDERDNSIIKVNNQQEFKIK